MRNKEMRNKKCVSKVSKNHFHIAPDNRSETSESFLFDFH